MISIIGRMDSRIALERSVTVIDAQGSVSQAWDDLASVWAEAKILSGNETTAGNERVATQDYTFKIRYQSSLADISATDRVIWRGSYFDILTAALMPEGRPDQILITARRSSFVIPLADGQWSDGSEAQWSDGTPLKFAA